MGTYCVMSASMKDIYAVMQRRATNGIVPPLPPLNQRVYVAVLREQLFGRILSIARAIEGKN